MQTPAAFQSRWLMIALGPTGCKRLGEFMFIVRVLRSSFGTLPC
jgi:hypothetical protein